MFKAPKSIVTAFAAVVFVTTSVTVRAEEEASKQWARGVSAFSAGDYEAATGYFSEAGRRGFDEASVLYYLGLCYYNTGRYEESLVALKEAGRLEADFRDYIYHYFIGAAYYRKRLYTMAANEMAEVVRLHPRSKVAEKAQEVLREISALPVEVPEETVEWYMEAARRGLSTGDTEWAEDYAREAAAVSPDSGEARRLLARVLSAEGKEEAAAGVLKNEDDAKTVSLRGFIMLKAGDFRGAAAAFESLAGRDESAALRGMMRTAQAAFEKGAKGDAEYVMGRMKERWPGAVETAEVKRLLGESR